MRHLGHSHLFDAYFASNLEETLSPFLIPSSRKWAVNLPIKTALLSLFSLTAAYIFHFYSLPLSYFALTFVYFLSGVPALLNALADLRKGDVNIDVLMTLAALLSVMIGSGLEGGLLLVLFELSGAMEEMVTAKTSSALYALNGLAPQTARVRDSEGHVYEKATALIAVDDEILIPAGEIVALDGIILSGSSSLNLSHLTGESRPLSVTVGELVHAGARNTDGALIVKVIRTSNDSTINRIVKLISKAQAAKPKLQQFLDAFSGPYALTIIGLSTFFALALPFIFDMPFLSHEGSIYRALSFLIAASPCALIIATPTAYLSALSACARKGILLKGGKVLDAAAQMEMIAFDKTGTLTTGDLLCTAIFPIVESRISIREALAFAAGLEESSTHPIATAILERAKREGVKPAKISDFLSLPGAGLQGNSEGTALYIGKNSFIESKKSGSTRAIEQLLKARTEKDANGNIFTTLLVADAAFLFTFSDELRKNLPELIINLRTNYKLHLTMLTGDNSANALQVQSQIGLDSFYADLSPEEKLAKVSELNKTKILAMVGDGVNDAPALAAASIGIAMGKIGSAAAVHEADVIFLQDDLSHLPWLIDRSKKTRAIIKQNLAIALSVIFLATTPALLGLIPLWVAVILHEGGTVIVGLNSLRLLRQ